MTYIENMPTLFNDEMMSDMLAGYRAMTVEAIRDEVVYSKSDHREHESEWRVYTGRGRTDGPYEDIPFNMAELEGVIFGTRTSASDRLALTQLLRSFYPHVTLYQATPKPDAYGLDIKVAAENGMNIPALTKIWLLLKILLRRTGPIIKSRWRLKPAPAADASMN